MGERDRLLEELAELAERVEVARRILDEIAEDEPPEQHRPRLILIRGGLSGVAVAAGTWVAAKVRHGVKEHPVAVSTTTLAGAGLAIGVMLAPTIDDRPESDDGGHAQRPPAASHTATTTDSHRSSTTQPGPAVPPSTTQDGPTSIPRTTHIPTGSTSRTASRTTTSSPTETMPTATSGPTAPQRECVVRLDLPGLIDLCLIDLTSSGGTPPDLRQGTAQQLGQRWATG